MAGSRWGGGSGLMGVRVRVCVRVWSDSDLEEITCIIRERKRERERGKERERNFNAWVNKKQRW